METKFAGYSKVLSVFVLSMLVPESNVKSFRLNLKKQGLVSHLGTTKIISGLYTEQGPFARSEAFAPV